MSENKFPIGDRITLPGHFAEPVVLESVRPMGAGYECRVRLADGTPDETILSPEEAEALLGHRAEASTIVVPADAEKVRLLVESARIRLAYAHDRHFAVSLSGIRTLPHQIEAVYLRMLPQPRLRFLLADDPGAGKTIMAGLLIKEMKLREAIERVLILCPAALTIQWQDELLRWFGEPFDIISSAVDQQQLVNPWQRLTQVIASLDYAKQDDVRERVWHERWDLVVIDEAHKCSAYTKSASGRGDEVEKPKRYQLAERLGLHADHLLLLTATPHHGDDDRFAYFIRLLDADLFPEPHRVGYRATEIRREIRRLGPDCPWALRRLGRIHRIGQERDVHAFNFVASDSEEGQPIVEGRILERLLEKLEQMRLVLADRVFDVIGEVLSLNDVNLPDMLREAAFDPRRLDDYLDQIERIDPKKLQAYEQATGIALARADVDFSAFQQANAEVEERRLMPRYVSGPVPSRARTRGVGPRYHLCGRPGFARKTNVM